MLPRPRAALLLLALLAAPAFAQYSWIDDKGTRVFSDRPPPPGTPAVRILKTPRTLDALAPAPAAPAAEPAKAAPTLAEREADFRKRQAEQAKADKKDQQDAQKQAVQAERCTALKRREMTLTAGSRLSEYDEKGQKSYVSDDERARRLAETRRMQAAECR
jgi:selenocysteine-specific translation elongation factor